MVANFSFGRSVSIINFLNWNFHYILCLYFKYKDVFYGATHVITFLTGQVLFGWNTRENVNFVACLCTNSQAEFFGEDCMLIILSLWIQTTTMKRLCTLHWYWIYSQYIHPLCYRWRICNSCELTTKSCNAITTHFTVISKCCINNILILHLLCFSISRSA